MSIHIVRQGECISSIASRYRLDAKALFNHADNAPLKKKRPNPNILAPGDQVVIPDSSGETKVKTEVLPTDHSYVFKTKSRTVRLRIVMLSARGKPYEGKRFVLSVGEKEIKGRTKKGGLIDEEVPAEAESAQLQVFLDDDDPDPDITKELAIGHLDPLDLVSGVQARLMNLGYPCEVTGEIDPATLVALHLFRARNNLPAVDALDLEDGGEADDDAQDKSSDGGDGQEIDADASASDLDNSDQTVDGEQEQDSATDDYAERLLDDPLRAKLQELYEGR